MRRIAEEAVDPGELLRAVSAAEVGGIATFFGTVRVRNAGRRVVSVEYQAYGAMAERILGEIEEEMRRDHGALKVALVHRIGRLEVGEISVGIAAGALHRREALASVAHAIERVKQLLPVWKREIYTDGSAWLEGAGAAHPERRVSGSLQQKKTGKPELPRDPA
jgi:molybdopterin synthase catalytic subunit